MCSRGWKYPLYSLRKTLVSMEIEDGGVYEGLEGVNKVF
jgi:hypothetical protein